MATRTKKRKSKYTIQDGDSWESLAGKFYGNQRLFAELLKANGGVALHSGMVINIPSADSLPENPNVTQFDVELGEALKFGFDANQLRSDFSNLTPSQQAEVKAAGLRALPNAAAVGATGIEANATGAGAGGVTIDGTPADQAIAGGLLTDTTLPGPLPASDAQQRADARRAAAAQARADAIPATPGIGSADFNRTAAQFAFQPPLSAVQQRAEARRAAAAQARADAAQTQARLPEIGATPASGAYVPPDFTQSASSLGGLSPTPPSLSQQLLAGATGAFLGGPSPTPSTFFQTPVFPSLVGAGLGAPLSQAFQDQTNTNPINLANQLLQQQLFNEAQQREQNAINLNAGGITQPTGGVTQPTGDLHPDARPFLDHHPFRTGIGTAQPTAQPTSATTPTSGASGESTAGFINIPSQQPKRRPGGQGRPGSSVNRYQPAVARGNAGLSSGARASAPGGRNFSPQNALSRSAVMGLVSWRI